MKKILILCTLALACGYSAFASVTESKVISHRFTGEGPDSKLTINSSYANINVTQAEQTYIDIKVDVKATARKKEDAEKMLNNINVVFSGRGSSCTAKTERKNEKTPNGSNFQITYTVTIPKGARLYIDSKYGNVTLGNMDGTFTSDVKYGNITSGELNGKGNRIDIKYGNVTITNSPDLGVSIGYGNMKAINIGTLKINSKYSNVNADYIGTVNVSGSSYDNYSAGKVHTFISTSNTSGVKIGTLIHKISLSGVKYGNVEIDRVEAGFESINISSSYSTVRIGFANPRFGYELYARYGDVKLNGLDHRNQAELRGHSDVRMNGSAGGYSGNANVKITANYGNIELKGK